MQPFLKQVARHYYASGRMEDLCFVFPNRRAAVFFRKYFGECVGESGIAVLSPALYTMNDFFYALAGAHKTGRVRLLLRLYECYRALNPQAESLDDFIFWGDTILSDFDDTDKYLADAKGLFMNVSDFKGMQGDLDYLTGTQKAAIERFLRHFEREGEYKLRFRRIWDILWPLYRDFRAALEKEDMAYEGMVYRSLADRLKPVGGEAVADIMAERFPGRRRFVFVGLNALNECEKRLLRRLRDAGMAEFCWDYSSAMLKAPHNRSSFFMRESVAEFPQAFVPDPDGLPETEFYALSVPSCVGQAKQLPGIFESLKAKGIETAVVLPDETLLLPVLNSIPGHIRKINVTMGYPMSGSELWTLMRELASLQLHLRRKDGKWYFYHRQVWAILGNSILKSIAGEDGAAAAARIRSEAAFYIPEDSFRGNSLYELIFRPVVEDASRADAQTVRALGEYQKEILLHIASGLKQLPDMAIELDFAREYYLAVNQLCDCGPEVMPRTYFRLLDKLMAGAAVPFKGEPLEGLQLMGPLETRALDFDNIVLLSCNEGMFPRRSLSSSFVPAELRKAFGLPTYERQDAVWAYYFYRMIQRASKVWMLYDSRNGSRSGEESRYLKQLELDFGVKVHRLEAGSGLGPAAREAVSIPKTAGHIDRLRSGRLSASSIEKYLRCPAMFYYSAVEGLGEKKEINEALDSGQIGTVFHSVMQELYGVAGGVITRDYIMSVTPGLVKEKVEASIRKVLNTFEVTGRNILFADRVCRYVLKTLGREVELMDRRGVKEFRILGLELKKKARIGGFEFVGYIDRLDSFREGEIRVVDYKTGKVEDSEIDITDSNAEETVSSLFGTDPAKRPEIALQLYIYDRLLRSDGSDRGMDIVNSIYSTQRMFSAELPEIPLSERFYNLMDEGLAGLLEEMACLEKDWECKGRTDARSKACEYCDFTMICGL